MWPCRINPVSALISISMASRQTCALPAYSRKPITGTPPSSASAAGQALGQVMRKGIDKSALASIILAHAAVDMQTISLITLLPSLLATFNLNYATAAIIITMNQTVIAIAQPIFGIVGIANPSLAGAVRLRVVRVDDDLDYVFAQLLDGYRRGHAQRHRLAIFHPDALTHARNVSGSQVTTGNSWFFLGGNIGFGVRATAGRRAAKAFGGHGPVLMIVPTIIGCGLLCANAQVLAHHATPRTQSASTELFANRRSMAPHQFPHAAYCVALGGHTRA